MHDSVRMFICERIKRHTSSPRNALYLIPSIHTGRIQADERRLAVFTLTLRLHNVDHVNRLYIMFNTGVRIQAAAKSRGHGRLCSGSSSAGQHTVSTNFYTNWCLTSDFISPLRHLLLSRNAIS
jgi:hypothetical protein